MRARCRPRLIAEAHHERGRHAPVGWRQSEVPVLAVPLALDRLAELGRVRAPALARCALDPRVRWHPLRVANPLDAERDGLAGLTLALAVDGEDRARLERHRTEGDHFARVVPMLVAVAVVMAHPVATNVVSERGHRGRTPRRGG